MPPPQHLLASKILGFVCRSCLSKLQAPHQQRIVWASRSFTSNGVRSGHKGAPQLPSTQFGETPGEETAESEADFDEESILEAFEEEIRARRKDVAEYGPSAPGGVPKSAVRYFEETPDGVRKEIEDGLDDENTLDALQRDIEGMKSDTGGLMERLTGGGQASSPLADELRAEIMEIEKVDLKNMSETERQRLRNIILGPSASVTPSEPHASPKPRPAADIYEASSQRVSIPEVVEIPVNEFPVAQQARVGQLNEALKRSQPSAGRKRRGKRAALEAKIDADKTHLLRVWKAYSLCRNALISLGHVVPRITWMRLWNIFQVEGIHNLDRWARLKTLGDDMRKAGVRLEPDKILMHIEATFIEGDQSHALSYWEKTSGRRDCEYWELGARMLAQHGEPDEALIAAGSCLQQSEASDSYRLLIPIIRAFLDQNTKSSVQRAWALYIRMRVSYSQHMTMEDYDIITSSFLGANQSDLALGVFTDMMLTGQPSVLNEDSTSQYKALTGTADDLSLLNITIHELDWQNPRALSKLPARMNNKFFFGKWLKKLIGEGKLEAAKKVLDLMDSRRVQPSAIHVNGLIGAWFRTGTEKNRALAEDMAWKMIKARNDFVQHRGHLDPSIRFVESTNLPSFRTLTLTPPATIETFCVLISQYRRRQKAVRMMDLFEAFQKSGIPPNTHFMNEMLLTSKRAHDKTSALQTYQIATEEQGVTPDFNTYKVLWGILRKDVDPIRGPNRAKWFDRYRRCRNLFADMISKLPRSSTEPFPQELYRLIIETFSFAQDLTGTAIALRALQRRFELYPDPDTARIVVLQLARLGLKDQFGEEPLRLDTNLSMTRERIASVTSILRQFKDQRVEALLQQGIVFSELQGKALKEEPLVLLSDVLRFADRQVEVQGGRSAAEKSRAAAKAMGVPDCQAWEDPTHDF